jgi:hypothetical protein
MPLIQTSSLSLLMQATLQCKQAIQSHSKLSQEKRELVDYISKKSRYDPSKAPRKRSDDVGNKRG